MNYRFEVCYGVVTCLMYMTKVSLPPNATIPSFDNCFPFQGTCLTRFQSYCQQDQFRLISQFWIAPATLDKLILQFQSVNSRIQCGFILSILLVCSDTSSHFFSTQIIKICLTSFGSQHQLVSFCKFNFIP